MGTVSICEPKIEQKNYQNEKESIKYVIKRQKPLNKISLKKENNIQIYDDDKIKFKNYSPKIKDMIKSKIFEPFPSHTKSSSNKCKTTSYNSYTLTTNNSKNINSNNKIITNDNITKKTITEEGTINNPDSVDYSNNTKLNNSELNKLKLNDSIQITKKKKKRMENRQIINIINEEDEDFLTASKIYKRNHKEQEQENKIKNFSPFSSEINSLHNSVKPSIKNNDIIYFSNLSSKITLNKYNNSSQNKIYNKSNNSQVKSGLTFTQNCLHKKTSSDKRYCNNLMNKKNKRIRISLDDKFMKKNSKKKKYKRYSISEFNSFYRVRKCESYKNENNILQKLRMTKINQEHEIKILKMKVNSLCNIIEDHKYIKENELKKKDKLILDLQKEKIKNEIEIKKLKIQLKKERANQNTKNIISNQYTDANLKKLNNQNNKNNRSFKRNRNIAHLNTEYTSINKNEKSKEVFSNIIYHKKSKMISDNLKLKIFNKNSPINLRRNIGNYIRRPLGHENNIIKYKDTNFIKDYNLENKIENQFLIGLNQNKSFFEKEEKNVYLNDLNSNKNINNIIYIPKRSKLSQKCVLFWNNKKRQLGKSKSTTNKNDMVLKFNLLNKENNDEIKNLNKNFDTILEENLVKAIKKNETNKIESISLNGTNKFNDSINKNEDLTMNLNFSPIIEDNSTNKVVNNDDTFIYDLFLLNSNINCNFNHHSENNSPKNVNKLNISQKNKNKTPSPIPNKAKKLSSQNLILKNIIRKVNYYINKEDKLKLSFIFGKEKIDFICKKNILFFNVINALFIKIKENDILNRKFGHILKNNKKIYFISNDVILDNNKTLKENNLNNHAKIFVIFDE